MGLFPASVGMTFSWGLRVDRADDVFFWVYRWNGRDDVFLEGLRGIDLGGEWSRSGLKGTGVLRGM